MTFAHVFDIGAACVLAFFVVRGVMRGLTGEIMSLLGLVASVACAWMLSRPLADTILFHFPNWDHVILQAIYGSGEEYYDGGTWSRTVLELICSAGLFMVVSLAFAVAAKILRSMIKAADLSLFDHFLGAFSGGARAFFAALFIYGVVTLFSSFIPSAWMQESVTMRAAAVAWPPVFKILAERGWLRVDDLAPKVPSLQINQINQQINALSTLSALSSLDALPAIPSLGVPAKPEGNAIPVP